LVSLYVNLLIQTVWKIVKNISKFEIVEFFIIIATTNVNVIVIYDKILLKSLSFFLKIGTSSVSAGAYSFIIIILNIHVKAISIYLIFGCKTMYLLKGERGGLNLYDLRNGAGIGVGDKFNN